MELFNKLFGVEKKQNFKLIDAKEIDGKIQVRVEILKPISIELKVDFFDEDGDFIASRSCTRYGLRPGISIKLNVDALEGAVSHTYHLSTYSDW